jgi:hypothetical protein
MMWASTGTLLLLAGCGGGGSSINTGPATGQSSPGGIWQGIESVSGRPVTGIVDESGNFQFVRSDDLQYVGTATVSGTSLAANMDGILPLGYAFNDSSHHGTGTVKGTITARTSIQSNTTFTTDNNTPSAGTLNLTFDTSYNRASALATIAGNFVDAVNKTSTAVLSIDSNGVMFSQDSVSGCVLNGSVSILNASYNAYKVQFNYASCTGDLSALNGVQFSGFATLNNSLSPETLLVAGIGASGNLKYSQVLRLNRN